MAKNIEVSKDCQRRLQEFQNEMTIILHTSRNVVDKQTYEVFSKTYALVGNAALEMRLLIEELESKTIPTQP